jgi:hypothetical protein
MFDTRASTPGNYVPSGGFKRATLATYTSRPYSYNHPTEYTGGWESQLLPYPLPYGFSTARPRRTDMNYNILTLPGLAVAFRALVAIGAKLPELSDRP